MKKQKFYSWGNCAFHPGRWSAPIFSQKRVRDIALQQFRATAIDAGLSADAAEAGIYPTTLPWSEENEILADI